jgi:hypothetical protein
MCLLISIEARPDQRERLLAAAELASQNGLRIDVQHASKWSWARERPVLATLTEDGGCSCSLLADDADWNAATWALRPDAVAAVVATLRILLEHGPATLRISALWAGESVECVEAVDRDEFLARILGAGLGTRTAYLVKATV